MTTYRQITKPATRRVLALWLPHLSAERPEAPAEADTRRLRRLAAWCRRYAPWTAPMREAGPGIWLETGGCAHLFGGEDAMCRAVLADLARAGHKARAGLAGTPGAAWALARCTGMTGSSPMPIAIAAPDSERAALAPLPVAALRLDTATVETLSGLGLRRIGDLYPFIADAPGRAELARRFPALLLTRLDAALGHMFEPISPIRERTRHLTRFTAPEPVHDSAAIARIAARLVSALAPLLAREGLGLRRMILSAFRTDGRMARIACGTARPLADAETLTRLLALRLPRLDAGPGADGFTLEAAVVEPLRAAQATLDGRKDEGDDASALAPLVERLTARLGSARVGHLAARPNHLPERAQAFTDALAAAHTPADDPATVNRRPLRLLARPAAIAAASRIPEGPPAWFRWGGALHHIARAEGPERIALDWWSLPGWPAAFCAADSRKGGSAADPPAAPARLADALRDYWRVEDTQGARFWLYRDGPWRPDAPERWFLHGVFP